MATLTYDPTPVDQPEFTEEEQDSLQVGEELAQQEANLLAGKFQDAEELEQAYLELQRKLGSREPQDQVPEEGEEQETVEDQEEAPDADFLNSLWNEAHTEYSQETLEKLKELRAVDIAQMHLEYRQQAESETPKYEVASKEQVATIQQSVGGEKAYGDMMQWAAQNLTEQEVQMYDTVMDRGDPLAMYFAAQALNGRYRDNAGYDGQMVTGKAPVQKADVYRSQAEVVAAMSDPRYENDPAYRDDIFQKLERSDLNY